MPVHPSVALALSESVCLPSRLLRVVVVVRSRFKLLLPVVPLFTLATSSSCFVVRLQSSAFNDQLDALTRTPLAVGTRSPFRVIRIEESSQIRQAFQVKLFKLLTLPVTHGVIVYSVTTVQVRL
jgi:hypothetical protein